MTTVSQCIVAKGAEGIVDKGKAESVAELYDEAVAVLMDEGRFSRAEAEEHATQMIQSSAERDILRKKQMAIAHAKILGGIKDLGDTAEAGGVGVDIAMSQTLNADPRERVVGPALASRLREVSSTAQSKMFPFLEEYRTKNAGLTQEKVGLDDFSREMHGENSNNPAAKAFADGVKEAFEYLRLRYNAAGGDILKRQDWGFFHAHDRAKLANVDIDVWRNFVKKELDMEKMVDVNGVPMSEKQVWAALGDAYESITSGGLSDLGPVSGRNLFGSSVNKRANSRFLHFKNADAWLKYQKEFGNDSIFDHVVGSMQKMSRDVAVLEILGPHPEAALKFMERMVDDASARGAISKTGKAAKKASEKLGQAGRPLQDLYNTVVGNISIPESGVVSAISQGNRNLVIASSLGSAWMAAISDAATVAITAKMNGLAANKVLARHIKMFAANSPKDRKLAVQLGFGAQGMASRALGAQRIVGETLGPEFTERLADTTMRASFLSPWTEAGRWAFGMEMLTHVTNSSAKSFDQLDPALKGSFERHGVTPADWDIIRGTQQWVDPESGANFIRAEDVAGGEFGTAKSDAANRLQQAIFTETEFAIISSDPKVRSVLIGGSPAGTFWGGSP